MKLRVNGEERIFETDSLSVAELLTELDIENHRVAVQVNDEVVKRGSLAEVTLEDGDVVQIVKFMGGGEHRGC